MSLLTIVLALPAAASASPPVAPAPVTFVVADHSFEELKDEYDEAYDAWYKRYRGAQSNEERGKIGRENPTSDFVPRFLALAEASPRSDDAFDAFAWVVEHGQGEQRAEALVMLERDFLEHTGLHAVCMKLREPSAASEAFLRRVVKETPHEDVRAWSTYALALQLMQQGSMAEMLGGMEKAQLDGYRNYAGAETVDALLKQDASARAKEIESLLETVCTNFSGESYESLLGSAKGDLFEIQNLAIGMVAPDIAAEDLDGVDFKLSDYRGKVVVLDFWGNW